MFLKIGFLKNFAIFTGKHLWWSHFLVLVCQISNYRVHFIKKRLQHKCFPVNIAKFLRAAFFYRTPSVAGFGALVSKSWTCHKAKSSKSYYWLLLNTCASGSALWIWLRSFVSPSICPSVRSQRRIWERARRFFLILSHKVRKVTESDFLKTVLTNRKDPRSFKKWGFWDFSKNLTHACVLFLLQYERSDGQQTFCKNHVWEKSDSWVMVQKLLEQSECRIS